MDPLSIHAPPSPSPLDDILSTLSSLLRLSYFLLSHLAHLSTVLLHFVSIKLPIILYSVLSWGATVTLKLNFTKVAIGVGVVGTVLSWVWKVRYLNRYTKLREVPLVKDEGFDL